MSHCLHLSKLQLKVTKDQRAFLFHVQVILSMVSAHRWVNLNDIFCVLSHSLQAQAQVVCQYSVWMYGCSLHTLSNSLFSSQPSLN